MNDTSPEANYVARMQDRISTMEVRVPEHLPSTEALFAATAQLREQVLDQRDDAHMAAGLLERGTEQEEALAQRLTDYSQALESALDINHPAPHYQATVSGLDQRLDPVQMEAVMESDALQHCADASLENALYSGEELLATGNGGDHPAQYQEHKRSWDTECSAGTIDAKLYGYTPMGPVKEQVRLVLSDDQIIEHDQRQIDAVMISHLPSAHRLGVDPLERHAADYYGAPMIKDQPASPDMPTAAELAHSTDLNLNQQAGPSLG